MAAEPDDAPSEGVQRTSGAQVECSEWGLGCISMQLCGLTCLHQAINDDGCHQHVCLQQTRQSLRAECHSDYSCTPKSACCAFKAVGLSLKMLP